MIGPTGCVCKLSNRQTRRSKTSCRSRRVVLLLSFAVLLISMTFWNCSRGPAPSAEQVTAKALEALAAGNVEGFIAYVDVRGFVCCMDTTGVTTRDYEKASRKDRRQLETTHADMLIDDFFVQGNMERRFEVMNSEIEDDSASLAVKPWVQFGRKLYRRILLHKDRGKWRISGLASPDY